MIFRAIGRMLIIVIGLCLSLVVGLCILIYLGGGLMAEDLSQRYGDALQTYETGTLFDILGAVAFLLSLYPAMTIIPPILMVVIGEIGHIRSILYYILAGGAASLAIPLLYVIVGTEQADVPSQSFLAIFATAGFGAGLIYWLIAGRKA